MDSPAVSEAVEHADAFADLVRDALGGGLVELLAVLGGGEVDGENVTVGCRTIHLGGGGEALAQDVDALLDGVIGHLGGLNRGLEGGEVGEVELGADVHLGGELHHFVVLELGDVHLRLAEGEDAGFGNCLLVGLGECLVDGLLQDDAAAEALVDDGCRHLALAESGDVDLSRDFLVRLVKVRLQIGERNLDGELHARRAELL